MTTPFIRTTLVTLAAAALLLAATTAQAQARYTYSTAGDEVTDTKTGLTWRRCSEGQTWSGISCNGIAATYTHEQALANAKAQADAVGWRLPNVKELSSIAEKTRTDPVINTSAFPATPSYWYWTSTPYASNSGYAWSILFNNGNVSSYDRSNYYHVRLVR